MKKCGRGLLIRSLLSHTHTLSLPEEDRNERIRRGGIEEWWRRGEKELMGGMIGVDNGGMGALIHKTKSFFKIRQFNL